MCVSSCLHWAHEWITDSVFALPVCADPGISVFIWGVNLLGKIPLRILLLVPARCGQLQTVVATKQTYFVDTHADMFNYYIDWFCNCCWYWAEACRNTICGTWTTGLSCCFLIWKTFCLMSWQTVAYTVACNVGWRISRCIAKQNPSICLKSTILPLMNRELSIQHCRGHVESMYTFKFVQLYILTHYLNQHFWWRECLTQNMGCKVRQNGCCFVQGQACISTVEPMDFVSSLQFKSM